MAIVHMVENDRTRVVASVDTWILRPSTEVEEVVLTANFLFDDLLELRSVDRARSSSSIDVAVNLEDDVCP